MFAIFNTLTWFVFLLKIMDRKICYFCLFGRLWKTSLIFCTFTCKWVSFHFFVIKYWQKVLILPCFLCRHKTCFNIEQLTLTCVFLKTVIIDVITPFNFWNRCYLFQCDYFLFLSFHCWSLSYLLFQGHGLLVEFLCSVTIHLFTTVETSAKFITPRSLFFSIRTFQRHTNIRYCKTISCSFYVKSPIL